MSEPLAVCVPQEYVNDDTVKLLRWFVKNGQEVHEGETIAELETSKAVVELMAAANGRLFHYAKPTQELRVGEILGYISANGDVPTPPGRSSMLGAEERRPCNVQLSNPQTDVHFSKKALELMRAHGLSSEHFTGRGLVRERDVLQYLSAAQDEHRAHPSAHFALDGMVVDRITFPSGLAEQNCGLIDPDFLSRLRADSNSFARLSSVKKCELYRRHGGVIGESVVLGQGTALIAPRIVIGDHVHLAENTSVECRERFVVGQLTSFRAQLSVRGGTVVLGENVFGGRNVQIGGGGNGDPQSLLCVGNGTYIGDDVFINICRPVLIGKEVFLTQRSVLVTHNIGHSILEGYENRFAPIVVEDYAQVGMNCTVYAGARIGRGSIVMSNSYLVSSVPPGKLAAGVPARVIREATRPLDRQRQIETVHMMAGEFHDLLARKGHAVSDLHKDPSVIFEVRHKQSRFRLSFLERFSAMSQVPGSADESIIWTLNNECTDIRDGFSIMDLLAKTFTGKTGIFVESTREFLRKRGIRLEPGPWRYQGGLI